MQLLYLYRKNILSVLYWIHLNAWIKNDRLLRQNCLWIYNILRRVKFFLYFSFVYGSAYSSTEIFEKFQKDLWPLINLFRLWLHVHAYTPTNFLIFVVVKTLQMIWILNRFPIWGNRIKEGNKPLQRFDWINVFIWLFLSICYKYILKKNTCFWLARWLDAI